MAPQKSQPRSHKPDASPAIRRGAGTLFIVGTPIGSPDDLTIRARAILRQVSIVAAETPLATQALLAHHGISARITSYGPGQYEEKISVLIEQLKAGRDVALVSDSGMPVIYDPGRLLIAAVHESGCPVTIIPGPSALTAAVAISGYSGDRIVFNGRLPQTGRLLDGFFASLKKETGTIVMFASPRALSPILKSLARVLPNRQVTLAVNMTREDEGLYQGCARSLLDVVRSIPRKSEVTVVLAGAQKNEIRKRFRRSKKN
jgi:16S rRNA (cytidine1402-2'-O)-methyltransferase